MSRQWLIVGSVAAGGAAAACLLAAYIYRRRQYNKVTDFIEIGTVSQLNLYPVKSMKGISVSEMECTKIGGKNGEIQDRNFMVMDADSGKVVYGGQINKLVTIHADIKDHCLTLSADEMSVTVNIDDVVTNNIVRQTDVWSTNQDGLDCGDDVANFLQKYLETDKNLRLILFVEGLHSERYFEPKTEWVLGTVPSRRDLVAFPNECPYHTICENSLRDLNSRLEAQGQPPIRMIQFRPIIQIEGPPPFDEDMWSELRIGDVTFACYKPSTRCVFTTVDPDTGIRSPDTEPLKTLRQYRLAPGRLREVYKQKPVFGVFMGVNDPGRVIRVGDKVFARYKTHRY